jgi:hypothetical protein
VALDAPRKFADTPKSGTDRTAPQIQRGYTRPYRSMAQVAKILTGIAKVDPRFRFAVAQQV